ncbi:uncharacterized protein PV06_08782 [Exophiala oligosperma]|uniref:N-acetyltransferase domain-containing protein n=2 Tax=Chaetothyriales TaxID=34395 RepID=A0A0D2D728_9EURO|nr:uncharacterized protein PV06_08782 [Exophiala oligosperma]KAJ9644928.1 hypothetical protein H2204_001390 [Knufia peltigerae]KIW38963.1 hypothetical protein PV06_08782 [Exophiala oligosperma]
MGRHHHLRLPEHLYLSPPTPPQPSAANYLTSASSFFAVNKAVYYSPSAALFQETGRPGGFAVGDRIPGFKTSAAFFNTLRANLVLDPDSTPPSLPTTPDVLRPTTMASSGGLPPPSPSPLGTSSEVYAEDAVAESKNPLDDIPDLTTRPAVSEDDKVEALHLLADSVAQQRQVASSAIMYHPLTLGTFVLGFGLVYQYLYKGQRSDWMLIGTTTAGILMSILVTIRWLTGGYLEEAENVGTWKWLSKGRETDDSPAVGDADEILLTRFGDEVVGTVIIRGERETPSGGSPRKPRRNAPATGVIRGWTVKRRYRRKGVGQGLLEEAVKVCQIKGWNGPEFAADHAHSARPLPATFSGTFTKRDRQARDMLEKVKEEMTPTAGKRGKR